MAGRGVQFQQEVDRLQAEALARIQEAHDAHVAQLMHDLQALRADAIAELQSACIPASIIPSPEDVCTSSIEDIFTNALLQPTLVVCIDGVKVHVHRHVLKRIPYFSAFIDGPWSDSDLPKVNNLPCSVEEFILLLRRLYTGERLGSASLPVASCAAALRLCAAAAMLLIEDRLEELPDLLQSHIVSLSDVQLAAKSIGVLPDSLNAPLRSLCRSEPLAQDVLDRLIRFSTTEDATKAAEEILHSQRGLIDENALATSILTALSCSNPKSYQDYMLPPAHQVKWLMQVASCFLSIEEASSFFANFDTQIVQCSRHSGAEIYTMCAQRAASHESLFEVRSAYMKHLLRCARQGSVASALVHGISRPKFTGGNRICSWQRLRGNSGLLLFSASQSDELVEVVRSSPTERAAIARQLAKMHPADLAKILSAGMVRALKADAKPIIIALAEKPNVLIKWASRPLLELLPHACLRVVCTALVGNLDEVGTEVSSMIARTLART